MQTDPSCLRASLRSFALVCLFASVVSLPASVKLRRNESGTGNSSAQNSGAMFLPGTFIDSDEDPAYDDDQDIVEDTPLDELASKNSLSIQAFLDSSAKAFDPVMNSITEFFHSLLGALHDPPTPSPPSQQLGKLGGRTASRGRSQIHEAEYLFYR